MARPNFEATEEIMQIVKDGSMYALTWSQIAQLVSVHLDKNVSVKTLQRHCSEAFDKAPAEIEFRLKNILIEKALVDKDYRSITYLLSRKFGWTEKTLQEHSGKDGGAIETKNIVTTENVEDLAMKIEKLLEQKF